MVFDFSELLTKELNLQCLPTYLWIFLFSFYYTFSYKEMKKTSTSRISRILELGKPSNCFVGFLWFRFKKKTRLFCQKESWCLWFGAKEKTHQSCYVQRAKWNFWVGVFIYCVSIPFTARPRESREEKSRVIVHYWRIRALEPDNTILTILTRMNRVTRKVFTFG